MEAAPDRRRIDADDGGCRLSTLERTLFDVRRVGDVPGFEIPGRFFQFLRTGDPRPLEPVLEHNRLDLVSLAAVTARAVRLAENGVGACRDANEALALGRVYERGGNLTRAELCYRTAAASDSGEVRGESLYRLGLRLSTGSTLRGSGGAVAGAAGSRGVGARPPESGAGHAAAVRGGGAGDSPGASCARLRRGP